VHQPILGLAQVLGLMQLPVSGLLNCGINTLATVGANFTISYWAWSATLPPLAVVVNRTVSEALTQEGTRSSRGQGPPLQLHCTKPSRSKADDLVVPPPSQGAETERKPLRRSCPCPRISDEVAVPLNGSSSPFLPLPPLNRSAVRPAWQVVITEPCPDPASPTLCASPLGGYFCAPTSCLLARQMMIKPAIVPSLALLPRNLTTVLVEAGSVPDFSLAPCPNGNVPSR
jgi:hypothetical protein